MKIKGVFSIAMIIFIAAFSVGQVEANASENVIYPLQNPDDWTEEEMKIVAQYNLRIDDSRGINLVSATLGNDVQNPDLIVITVKEALIHFMTTGFKKDLIFVRISDTSSLPDSFKHVLDIHDVVRLYIILSK